ncbi:unnamed protein product, partial [Amoebophrya sp. A25]
GGDSTEKGDEHDEQLINDLHRSLVSENPLLQSGHMTVVRSLYHGTSGNATEDLLQLQESSSLPEAAPEELQEGAEGAAERADEDAFACLTEFPWPHILAVGQNGGDWPKYETWADVQGREPFAPGERKQQSISAFFRNNTMGMLGLPTVADLHRGSTVMNNKMNKESEAPL